MLSLRADLNCEFNQLAPCIHKELFVKKGIPILKEITHVIDCECYRVDGKRFFRQVSILDYRTLSYEILHCFAEDSCGFYKMNEKSKYSARCQYSIHGLKFYNLKKKNFF